MFVVVCEIVVVGYGMVGYWLVEVVCVCDVDGLLWIMVLVEEGDVVYDWVGLMFYIESWDCVLLVLLGNDYVGD